MSHGTFPTDPSRRKAILVLSEHDVERCAYEPGVARELMIDETYVLQAPLREQQGCTPALQRLIDARLIQAGTLLIQNPYDCDSYEEATLAPQRFALAKHMYFSMICMHLGAKEVVVDQIHVHTGSSVLTIEAQAERAGSTGQVDGKHEELEKLRAQMHLRDVFEGGAADIEAAEHLLRQTGLSTDLNIRTLIEMRRGGGNRLKSRKLVLNLSSEAKSHLALAGRIKVPAFVKLSTELDRVVKNKDDFTLTVTVNF